MKIKEKEAENKKGGEKKYFLPTFFFLSDISIDQERQLASGFESYLGDKECDPPARSSYKQRAGESPHASRPRPRRRCFGAKISPAGRTKASLDAAPLDTDLRVPTHSLVAFPLAISSVPFLSLSVGSMFRSGTRCEIRCNLIFSLFSFLYIIALAFLSLASRCQDVTDATRAVFPGAKRQILRDLGFGQAWACREVPTWRTLVRTSMRSPLIDWLQIHGT